MSTKSTLAHGPNFHFYSEAFDDDYVYLELEGAQFEAAYNRVMVPIPVHIWEVIRRYPGIEFDYADMTDDELRDYVESEVDERMKHYAEAPDKAKALASLHGFLQYGSADNSRAEQIATGIAHFTKIRDHQREVQRAIGKLNQLNQNDTSNQVD